MNLLVGLVNICVVCTQIIYFFFGINSNIFYSPYDDVQWYCTFEEYFFLQNDRNIFELLSSIHISNYLDWSQWKCKKQNTKPNNDNPTSVASKLDNLSYFPLKVL